MAQGRISVSLIVAIASLIVAIVSAPTIDRVIQGWQRSPEKPRPAAPQSPVEKPPVEKAHPSRPVERYEAPQPQLEQGLGRGRLAVSGRSEGGRVAITFPGYFLDGGKGAKEGEAIRVKFGNDLYRCRVVHDGFYTDVPIMMFDMQKLLIADCPGLTLGPKSPLTVYPG